MEVSQLGEAMLGGTDYNKFFYLYSAAIDGGECRTNIEYATFCASLKLTMERDRHTWWSA